jgi:hypothetical protein
VPLTAFQRGVCRLIAANRVKSGESYVAGGVALNELTSASRLSQDIDLFHDTREALINSWLADRRELDKNGYSTTIIREMAAFIEAEVARAGQSVRMQWCCDSAFRFFPLIEHPDFGLVLSPFDLATNKILALVGRAEVRDWIDALVCHQEIQPLGCLVWACAGKDPGLNPGFVLNEAKRASRYTSEDIAGLSFEGISPDLADLSGKWRLATQQAEAIINLLPEDHVGECVLDQKSVLFRGEPGGLKRLLEKDSIQFHKGHIGGSLPVFCP